MNNQSVTFKREDMTVVKVESLEVVNQADKDNASTSKRKRDTTPEPKNSKEERAVHKKANIEPESKPEPEPENAETEKVIPMNRDSYFYCRRCNKNIKGCREYYGHIKSAHNIAPRIKGIKHLDLQPDVDDPDFYCRACERPHTDKNLYNTHLRRVHHMLLPPLGKKPKKPDPKNPDYYCTACDKKYQKATFRRHMRLSHKIIVDFSNNQ